MMKDNKLKGFGKVTRVEYITKKDRSALYGEFYFSFQDDGKTLKIFNKDWFGENK